MHYYNEIDGFAAAWLRELIKDGQIPDGHVDERSIRDVTAADLVGYDQHHFFAGIGGWPYALVLAGWPATRPVWSGSCPCQPFSAAGGRRGAADERHLWPEFRRLIAECRPAAVFGEQVASSLGREWLTGVRADLEALAYAVGAADLCAASVGAPHIRQRLFWVADNTEPGRRSQPERADQPHGRPAAEPGRLCGTGGMADADLSDDHERPPSREQQIHDGSGSQSRLADAASGGQREQRRAAVAWGGGHLDGGVAPERVGDPIGARLEERPIEPGHDGQERAAVERAGGDAGWLPCLDGKARRVEPGIFPLADGVPNRMGTLRGAGNAIVPALAAQFIRAYAG